ncbi:MAG: hypothetical protein AAF318_12350 [Pseudomonadota bacterium]
MVPTTFRVAMANRLRLGPYSDPASTGDRGAEWLIVERVGALGEVLFVSDTAPCNGLTQGAAPPGLAPKHTLVALLAEDDETPKFLIVRQRPAALPTPGLFFPADGCVRLTGHHGRLGLRAFGRHAHSRGTRSGATVLIDVPDPAPAAEGAVNWHFEAEQRPWPAEI